MHSECNVKSEHSGIKLALSSLSTGQIMTCSNAPKPIDMAPKIASSRTPYYISNRKTKKGLCRLLDDAAVAREGTRDDEAESAWA